MSWNWKRVFLAVVGVLLVGLAIVNLAAPKVPAHPFFDQFEQYPLVIAHAGSELYPTDTMYALAQYAAMGVDVLEMDAHMSADGVIVLIHDDTVDRTTDGSGVVWEMSFEELQTLDAGYYWTKDEGQTYPYRGQGITIPSLEEVLQAFPGYPMIIEIKQESPSMTGPLCELLREYGVTEQVLVPGFDDAAMREFRQACPEVATAASEGEVRDFVIRNFLLVSGTAQVDYQAFQVPESRDGIPVVTRWFLWAAQRRNIQVHIWTVNEQEDMVRFVEMGLDGIMTDRTDLLLEVLGW